MNYYESTDATGKRRAVAKREPGTVNGWVWDTDKHKWVFMPSVAVSIDGAGGVSSWDEISQAEALQWTGGEP